jgi:steroid 5-alpha reductase family enzyme
VIRWSLLGGICLVAALAMSVGWLWQQRHSNAGIVDVLWSALLATSAVVCGVSGEGAVPVRTMLALAGGIWGMRLALHLGLRMRSEHEDGRYRYLRSQWGNAGLRWFALFQFQALLVTLFSVPFVIVAGNSRVAPSHLILAAIVWCGAVAGETLADRQLASFRLEAKNRGRTCRTGLWRYSRHPNYFFEWLTWFSYPVLALGAPWGALTWIGPALMLLFLRYLSGIPFTEAQALRTRGEDYRDYQRRTSMLIPWPPRS